VVLLTCLGPKELLEGISAIGQVRKAEEEKGKIEASLENALVDFGDNP
jgi:hypothetical protein